MRKVSLAVLLTTVIALVGCGGDDGGGEESGELTPVTVGLIPITPVAPVYLGIEQGFFEEEGLDVEPQLFQGGSEIIPAMQAEEAQFGFSNSVSILIAGSQGLPVRVVAPGESSPTEPSEDNSAIMVPQNSDIRTPQDLEGATIGVNTLENIAGLTTEAALEEEGVDTDTLDLVEVPFPEMLAATEGGDVDAGFFNEPFTTIAEQEGARTIVRPYTATAPELPIAPYIALQPYVDENPEVIAAFQRAMERSTQYAIDNPDELRQSFLDYTEIPEPVADEIRLPFLGTELDTEKFQQLADLSLEFDYVDEEPNVDELLVLPDEAEEAE